MNQIMQTTKICFCSIFLLHFLIQRWVSIHIKTMIEIAIVVYTLKRIEKAIEMDKGS